MEKQKTILLKLTESQFKELAHAKVESGEKSWETFFLSLKTRVLSQHEYEILKMVFEDSIDHAEGYEGIDGTNPVQKELNETRSLFQSLQSRYEKKKAEAP